MIVFGIAIVYRRCETKHLDRFYLSRVKPFSLRSQAACTFETENIDKVRK